MREQLKAFYLDYLNNYLTTVTMALDYSMTEYDVRELIRIGKRLHEEDVKR